MILLISAYILLFLLGCYVGIRWERKHTLRETKRLVQDYMRMHALTNRTADVLGKIDPVVVRLANEEILAEEGAELLETLEEDGE